MNIEKFDKLVDELTNDRKKVADGKREDYTKGSKDVLANFKNQSEDLGIRPEQSLAVHMEKQFSAVLNFIKSEGQSESEPIIKRIGDSINYLELLWGLLNERGLVESTPQMSKETVEKILYSDRHFTERGVARSKQPKNISAEDPIYKIVDIAEEDAHYCNFNKLHGTLVELYPDVSCDIPIHAEQAYKGVVKNAITGETHFFKKVLLKRV